ncbi:MAG: response regulator [Lachnospiraceae bacterium]
MSTHSSGYYSIDADYNIIGFNDTAKQIYPNLELNQKCYKALMGLDSPCPPCPVANGIHGPKTYLDPIRHIYETVDAVETVLADGSRGHALVFSTVAEGERLSSTLPTGENSLRLLGAINLLSFKYSAVFGVNMQSQKISVFRFKNLFGNSDPRIVDNMDYNEMLDLIITQYVHPQERQSIRELLTFERIQEKLSKVTSFKVHCKILQDEVHYYYLMIARNGEASTYQDIVLAIACEDDDINARRIYEKQLNSLLSSISQAAGYFHLDITKNRVLKVGGTSEIVNYLNRDYTIDMLMQSMAIYILSEKDRQDFLHTYSLEAMKQGYESGKVEIVLESRCYYDDNIARWSRYTLRLFVNPTNSHLEGVFYGMDVTQDKEAYETQVSIVQTLSSNYLDVFLLNTREKTASIIKHDGFMSTFFEKDGTKIYPYDELLKKYISKYVHPDDQMMMTISMKLSNVLEALNQNKEYSGNYRIIHQEETHHYQFRFIKNEEYGIVVLGFLNVDDIVAAEIEQQQKLQKALDDAKRANSEKSRFLARMSHDMRTPLNGIIGILEIDQKHADDIDYLKKNRRKATVVTNHLVSLINDVLDMAKIEEGSLILAHEPFSIMDEGQEATVLINLQAQEAGITTTVNFTSQDERLNYVYGSPLHLRRAMMNIYSNCIKYNQTNGKITTDIQIIRSDEQSVTYRWIITDTGIGMSQEFLTRIFDPFVQAETDARSVYQGTGLGMSIAKALIEKMGGTLEVSSELGVGSTFVVTIPFELANKNEIKCAKKVEKVSIKGMKILLAEDNELNRDIAETILAEEGAQITSVINGKEAVEAIRNHPPQTFDLVLMDIMMPIMDGYEATRQIRQMGRSDTLTLPIIAMTANAFEEDIKKSLDEGMDAHITKPLDIPNMIRTIAQYKRKN